MDHEKLREAIKAAHEEVFGQGRCLGARAMIDAGQLELLRAAAESTLPKTKMVEVWRVEWAQLRPAGWCGEAEHWPSKAGAESRVLRVEQLLNPGIACIRVTGPHQQEVPA